MSGDAPVVEVMLLADMIIRDLIEKKWSAVGMYTHVLTTGFPLQVGRIGVYARLAGVRRTIVVHVCVCDEKGLAIASHPQEIKPVEENNGFEQMGGYINNVLFQRPGRYSVQIHFGGEILGETRLEIAYPRGMEPIKESV